MGVGCGAMNVICCCFHRNKEIFRKAEEDGVGVLNFEKALKVRVGTGGWGMQLSGEGPLLDTVLLSPLETTRLLALCVSYQIVWIL